MKILDLYCCAGGAAKGYEAAGFSAYGVDIDPQPNYPYPFHQGDAIAAMRTLNDGGAIDFTHPRGRVEWLTLADFHAGHASPPCQAFSKTKTLHDNEHPDLIEPTREVLNETGLPWVIENVVGAPLVNPIRLSGQHFGMVADDVDGVPLKLVRHRLFESNIFLTPPQEFHTNKHMQTASVYGAGGGWTPKHRDNPERRGGYIPHIDVIKELLGIDWMTKHELSQSIPPKFAEWVGGQLMDHLIRRAQDQTRKAA